jgi:hypothetical protein
MGYSPVNYISIQNYLNYTLKMEAVCYTETLISIEHRITGFMDFFHRLVF